MKMKMKEIIRWGVGCNIVGKQKNSITCCFNVINEIQWMTQNMCVCRKLFVKLLLFFSIFHSIDTQETGVNVRRKFIIINISIFEIGISFYKITISYFNQTENENSIYF